MEAVAIAEVQRVISKIEGLDSELRGARMVSFAVLVTVVFLTVPAVPAMAEVTSDVKEWLFVGDVNLRIPMSELNFPTGGAMPILTLGVSRVTLQYGCSALQRAVWTDSDWTGPQPMVGTRP